MVDTVAGDPRTGGRGERLAEPGWALAMASLALQVVTVSIVLIRRSALARAALPGAGRHAVGQLGGAAWRVRDRPAPTATNRSPVLDQLPRPTLTRR